MYDIEVDTGAASPAECAKRIRDFLPNRPFPTAFQRLKTV
ncbi:hypothetical protein [Kitasatospora sp. LaBMicrA B282]